MNNNENLEINGEDLNLLDDKNDNVVAKEGYVDVEEAFSDEETTVSDRSGDENNEIESETEQEEENDENTGFKIIEGDGSEIEISAVYDHLSTMKPKTQDEKTKRPIVIPQVKPLNNPENEENK